MAESLIVMLGLQLRETIDIKQILFHHQHSSIPIATIVTLMKNVMLFLG